MSFYFIQREIHLPGPEARTKTITQFMENDLVLYCLENIRRSIPSVMDGFSRVVRKVFYSLRKESSNEPIKVANVSALVSEHSVYHHGEECLYTTVIKMAQDFVGANNLALLEAVGHFGTRDSVIILIEHSYFLVYLAGSQ